MPLSSQSKYQFEQDVALRFGVVPNFFRSAPDAPELMQQFWDFAKSAYLDNPLPSLFKERLFVHLSRFGKARYSTARHTAFLLGYGHSSGDLQVKKQTLSEVTTLLLFPAPSAETTESAMKKLSALPSALNVLPDTNNENEVAVFTMATVVLLDFPESAQARQAIRHALGNTHSELLFNFLAFVRTELWWTALHPEIVIEDDVKQMLVEQKQLADLLSEQDEVRTTSAQPYYKELQTLRRERERRTELLEAKKELEERDQQKNKFIAMLGHELRNPVAAITAVSEMFQMLNTEDNRLRNASNILQRQTQVLAHMLDDLLDVSTLAFGKFSIAKSSLAINEVLASVLRDFEPQFKAKGLNLISQLPAKSVNVMADRTRLAQVFENILSNAMQFTKAPGHVSIDIKVDRKHVAITFADSGSGFEPEFSKKMFEPFAQAPQDMARKQGGLGLGLAIAKTIAELHDGSLQAVSAGIGKGASFTLTIPLNGKEPGGLAAKDKNTHAVSRIRVLVIEDNRDFAQLFRDMLQIMGCDPDVANTARAGFEIAKKSVPDMIFCDIGLPGDMDGFDFARALRADIELAHIPLIAVSGYTSEQDKQQAVSAGFDRICPKPVKFADISEALNFFSKGKLPGR